MEVELRHQTKQQCSICKKTKAACFFSFKSAASRKLRSGCKECRAKQAKVSKKKMQDKDARPEVIINYRALFIDSLLKKEQTL